MKSIILLCLMSFTLSTQEIIPLDTNTWAIQAKAYVLENYKGKDVIYLHQGFASLKNRTFKNGTIEFDVYLTERQAFPGISFRYDENGNGESFFLRPHLSGKPDANQAVSFFNGITAWQLYFGERYSFTYDYNFNGWTHVKVVVNENKAQAFLDYSEEPNISWNLKHKAKEGGIGFGHSFAPMHYANFRITEGKPELKNFSVKKLEKIENIVRKWTISDKFKEDLLADKTKLNEVIRSRKWLHTIEIDDEKAVNISMKVKRYGSPGNTVFAKIIIDSDKDQIKAFDFGYSDRVVAILNGKAIYKGNNKWRSRDYRYLGTIGFFDGIYLDLKKGKNTLLLAISEDFGGWLVTGKFDNMKQIKITY